MAYRAKYNEISEITGIAKQPKRMSVPKSAQVLTNSGNGGIIKADIKIGRSLGASVKKDIVLLPNGNRRKKTALFARAVIYYSFKLWYKTYASSAKYLIVLTIWLV